MAMMAMMCTLFTLSAVAQSYKEVTMSAVGDSDVLSSFVGVIKESQVGSLLFDRYQLCAGDVVYKPFGYGKSREGIFFARYCPLRLLLFGKLGFVYVYLR
ncbi:MAG: hypothetical protein IKT53_06675 [Bacteroidaceae bacterium]|nr:hypothetical protein [Bacteroidaceae bacterium]